MQDKREKGKAKMDRKEDVYIRESMHGVENSNKKPRTESRSVNIEVTNPISASLLHQKNLFEIPVLGNGDGVHGVQQDRRQRLINGIRRGGFLVTNKLVGNGFRRDLGKIWSFLMEKNVSRIGVYGMGGVGKTEMAKHIYNNLLMVSNYVEVYWITVSPNFTIHRLQNAIAKAVNLDLSGEDDENIRAARLSVKLIKKKKFFIILDDVWRYIPLHNVGIPDRLSGCKLILTTRSLDVCRMMDCQENVQVRCLLDGEAWELFINELGTKSGLWEKESVKKSIVERCGGLPLMIISMARRTRAVGSASEWRDALEEVKGPKMSGAYMEVLHKLKLSYDHLEDQSLQQCFLYCALFDELDYIDELIELMVVEKIINGMHTRQAKLDKGHALIEKLRRASLLLDYYVDMHELVRKMAFQIMNDSRPSMIQIGEQIKYLPDREQLMENIVRISFTKTDNISIHSDYFPRCSNVLTLLLHDNEKLESMEDVFFDRFRQLKVLNLSRSSIGTLPRSVNCLEDLRALFLEGCCRLRYIPSLAKLESLEVLDLSDCSALEEVPDGVELFSNLRYLNLLNSGINGLPAGILTRLLRLEFLAFNRPSINVSAKEIADLPKLESLIWCFDDIGELYAYLDDGQRPSLTKYFLCVGQFDPVHFSELLQVNAQFPSDREVLLSKCSMSRTLIIQKGVEILTFREVSIDGATGLRLINAEGVNSFEAELRALDICYVDNIQYVFNVWSSPSILGSIKSVKLVYLDQLRDLFGRERDNGVAPPTMIPDAATFSNLKFVTIERCNSMKKLFLPSLLANLQNLEDIEVTDCSEMEEILAAPEQESSNSVSHLNFDQTLQFSLPKLKTLVLSRLPALKSICSEQIKCNSLEDIWISECENLKHIPISLPLPSLENLQVFPKTWWESVQWGTPDQKHVLQPQFVISEEW